MNRIRGVFARLLPAGLLWVCLFPMAMASSGLEISADYPAPGDTISLTEHWLFMAGDRPEYALPDWPDSDWVSGVAPVQDNPGGVYWRGVGWFRVHLQVDSSLFGQSLGLMMYQSGACEIYFNGQLVRKLGEVGSSVESEREHLVFLMRPIVLPLSHQSPQVLAFRYSSFRHNPFWGVTNSDKGVDLQLADLEWSRKDHQFRRDFTIRHQVLLTGVSLTFCLIHLFAFMFLPQLRANLYFALFTASTAVLSYMPAMMVDATSYAQFAPLHAIFMSSIVCTSFFGLWFSYALFYERMPRPLWIAAGMGALLVLLSWWIPRGVIYIYSLLVLSEWTRVMLVAISRRKQGSVVIGIGYMAFGLSASWTMLLGFGLVPRLGPAIDNFAFLYGLLVLLFTMSIFLAWQFATTNKKLAARLKQVQELSDLTLAQEKAAVEQEAAQKLLRAEIDHQQKELEEARKLAKALSDLEEANQHLKDTQTQLVQSEKMASLGMLVAGVAHEINTPVGAISSMHETLVKALDKVDAAVSEGCSDRCDVKEKTSKAMRIIAEANRVISSGTGRVTNIVRRLRSFARLDEAELVKADINEGLEDTLTLLHHELKHTIKVVREYGTLPRIPCYAAQLNQVFLNLLVNARQAMKDGGTITITTRLEGDQVVVQIRDTGEGISREKMGRIFDPGYTTKGVGVGTGLGLSICYQIVETHRGHIKAESEVGKGTTFTITLPTTLDVLLNQSVN